MNRDTIFISHANPEDNDFAIWLASRLQLLGYKVWVDKEAMLGGEKIWEIIDGVIRNEATKFLLVYSSGIFQKNSRQELVPGKLKDGVSKELAFAETISKQNSLNDFIILMNIDRTNYGAFIGADRLNQISFWSNWADGFTQLEKKLRKDNVPTGTNLEPSTFAQWYSSRFVDTQGIYRKRERYYSSWWAIEKLPEQFYIYRFAGKMIADQAKKNFGDFPVAQIANHLVSFEQVKSFSLRDINGEYSIEPEVFVIPISQLQPVTSGVDFPTQRDAEDYLKSLLQRTFHLIMKNRGMFWYEMSNRRLAYFYTPRNLKTLKVQFPFQQRRRKIKSKQLLGRYLSLGRWHYAVSAAPRLRPMLCFSLKNHLTFTTDCFKVWTNDEGTIDSKRLHSQRRAKGKRMFNEAWRDLHLAFISGLKTGKSIEIALSSKFVLSMPDRPIIFNSSYGYDDPTELNRHDVLAPGTFDNNQEDETDA